MKFNIQLKSASLAVITTLGLSACGGGDSTDTTATGTFVDDPMSGLSYRCSSGSMDMTNNAGEFTCNEGDSITFSLGDLTLGSLSPVTNGMIASPYDLFADTAEGRNQAINMARLLQALDSDPNDDILTPDPTKVAKLQASQGFADADMTNDLDADGQADITLPTKEAAQTRMDQALSKANGTAEATTYWQTSKSDYDIQAGTAVEFTTAYAVQVLTNVPFPTPFYGVETDKDSDNTLNIATYSRVAESSAIWDRVRAYSYNADMTLPLSYENYIYGGYDKTNYGFDENNRLISETKVDVDGNQLYRIAYTLDEQGRVTLEQEFDANDTVTDSTTYEYQQGENGLTIIKTDYDGDTNIAANRVITRKYDSAGNLIQELDDRNGDDSYVVQTDYTYDSEGRLIYQETSDGDLDANGDIVPDSWTTFTYTTDPDSGNMSKTAVYENIAASRKEYWIYDANENLLENGRDNENDGITDYILQINTYDENNNRLTYARDADADGNYESLDVRTYDNQNRVLTVTSYSDAPDDSGILNGDLSGVDISAYSEYSYYDTKPNCDVIFADVTLDYVASQPTGECLITPLEAKTAFDEQTNSQP